jgi:YD repeat-containing protein
MESFPRPWDRHLRRLLRGLAVVSVALAAAVFLGPLTSGALFLLMPVGGARAGVGSPLSDTPLHKGYIDLATGLYVREDEDLIVGGTPALALRRTYLSGDRVSRQFGAGTTHAGELYLIGDSGRFQWAELILADGGRVRFDRISFGTLFLNAMFEHRGTPSEWQQARLGWTGTDWALRRRDGSLARFMSCDPGSAQSCSITQERGRSGHVTRYRRNASGRLMRIEASQDRWIAFDYDGRNRIARAHDSTGQEVRYEYDERGRLGTVKAADGTERRYTYSHRDEMVGISEPRSSIENRFDDNGRCIRQVNRFPDEIEPYIFDFAYVTEGDHVIQAESRQSGGLSSVYTFNKDRYMMTETWSRADGVTASFTYERDSATNLVTALTVTCPDRRGQPLRHSSLVRAGEDERIKQDLVQTHCSWSGRRWRQVQ